MTPSGVAGVSLMETASQEENDVHLSAYTHGCAGLPSDVRG